jgi:hypothetical protein
MDVDVIESHRHLLQMPRIAFDTPLVAPAGLHAARDIPEQMEEPVFDADLVTELPPQLIELDLGSVGPDAEHIGEVGNGQLRLHSGAPLSLPSISIAVQERGITCAFA